MPKFSHPREPDHNLGITAPCGRVWTVLAFLAGVTVGVLATLAYIVLDWILQARGET